MMYNYPFFSFPRPRRYGTPSYYGYPKSSSYSGYKSTSVPSSYYGYQSSSVPSANSYVAMNGNSPKRNMQFEHEKGYVKDAIKKDKKLETKSKNASNVRNEEDKVLFEILGISLYYDDVLLICLIFFLYQEGVQDQYLFLSLILLLLS